jgi:hypothetical protein
MTTYEGNKIIAEYFGVVSNGKDTTDPYNVVFDNSTYMFPERLANKIGISSSTSYHVGELRFHTSWEWLMPIIMELVDRGYSCSIMLDELGCDSFFFKHKLMELKVAKAQYEETSILTIWNLAIELIKFMRLT